MLQETISAHGQKRREKPIREMREKNTPFLEDVKMPNPNDCVDSCMHLCRIKADNAALKAKLAEAVEIAKVLRACKVCDITCKNAKCYLYPHCETLASIEKEADKQRYGDSQHPCPCTDCSIKDCWMRSPTTVACSKPLPAIKA
jgi:hypothetical protein